MPERAWERHVGGGGDVQPAALFGFGGTQGEPESFSPDRDWMPDLVLMAKSTYVWLDQLSRAYGRAIRTLDAVPDEELDRLRDAGLHRPLAHRPVGAQPASASASSSCAATRRRSRRRTRSTDYRIADDLGGEAAWQRPPRPGVGARHPPRRDMVPNHMGIDSRWVMDHPEWFIGRDDPPYPAYSWTGPNLSNDERVGI